MCARSASQQEAGALLSGGAPGWIQGGGGLTSYGNQRSTSARLGGQRSNSSPFCCAQVRARSEDDAEEEFLSVAVLKGGRKVVAGASDGVLNIFSWGVWIKCSNSNPIACKFRHLFFANSSPGKST